MAVILDGISAALQKPFRRHFAVLDRIGDCRFRTIHVLRQKLDFLFGSQFIGSSRHGTLLD